jgi:hypothetical protein
VIQFDPRFRVPPKKVPRSVAGHPADAHVIVDTGSSAFVPLAFRSQLQKELGLSIGPKDPLLALSAVRKAFEEGVARMEQVLAAGRRIAWLSLAASVVALTAAICAIFVHVIH